MLNNNIDGVVRELLQLDAGYKMIDCLKGTVQAKKILYYSFDSDENSQIHVKLKVKLGNHHELISFFFIKNELFIENV